MYRNHGYLTFISFCNNSLFKSLWRGGFKASLSLFTCVNSHKAHGTKTVQYRICGLPIERCWRNKRQSNISGSRTYSTHSGSLIRRKEVLIIIFAGIAGGVIYGYSKKLENDRHDRKMEEVDGLIKIAQESHHSGNNEITLRRYKDVLDKVIVLIDSEINSHKRMSKLTTKYAFIIDQMANLLHELGKLSEAEDCYKKLVQALISHGAKKDDDAVIEVSVKLASIYAEQERHELAENGLTWCVSNARRKMNAHKTFHTNSAALLGICLESYGKYRMSQRDAKGAITLFTEALEISRKVFGSNHQQVALLLNNLAVAYNEAGDVEKARKLFYESTVLAKEVRSRDLWSFHFNFANFLLQAGDLENATNEYEKAILQCPDEDIKSRIRNRMSKSLLA